ncbi:peroxidase 40 [Aristolochia californica]|uniref:peroxidase 40 n=1 Tax=Aristolochia californica TaxID=171875 RepID=UPI0035E09040
MVPSRKFLLIFFITLLGCAFIEACLTGRSKPTGNAGEYQPSVCSDAETIIFSGVDAAVAEDHRMAASLLRLHFHDCFVNGCDASVLLDDTIDFVGEKTAGPNLNSLRGFEVIDRIKSDLELACPETVSCADILAVAARDAVVLSGGPTWEVEIGRKDGLSASKQLANNNIPGPNSDVATLSGKFQNVGLNEKDMVVLSGAHTIGRARCKSFTSRLNDGRDAGDLIGDRDFVTSLQQLCSNPEDNATLAELDLVSPVAFDNQYYANLLSGEGLLLSDQALVSEDGMARELVVSYADDLEAFFEDFATSMVRMGSLGPSTGNGGEIRRDCRRIN